MSSTSNLKSAISLSDNETVSKLLEKMDIKAVNKARNETALHVSCDKNNLEALDLLLDVNVKDKTGLTPLYKACRQDNLKAVAKLLDRPEIDVNAKSSAYGWTSLHVTCDQNNFLVAAKLLDNPGIDVNVKSFVGHTPLHLVCQKNLPIIVRKLLASPGIDINARDAEGFSPIMDCVRCCSEDALKALLDDPRVNLDIKDKEGRGLKVKVRNSSYYSCLEMIKNERRRREMRAVAQVHTSIEEVNRKEEDETALHVASDKKNHGAQDMLLVKTANGNEKVEQELANEAGSVAEVKSTSQQKSAKVNENVSKRNAKTIIENREVDQKQISEAGSVAEVSHLNMSSTSQLKSAISSNDNETVSKLVGKMNLESINRKEDDTALYVACEEKNYEALDLVLAKTGIEIEVEQEQTSEAGSIGRHIVKIEKINKEIRMEKGMRKKNLEIRKKKMEDLGTKHKEELYMLEKNQSHQVTELLETLAREDHNEEHYIVRLKEHRDELAQELVKLSSDERSKLEPIKRFHSTSREIEEAVSMDKFDTESLVISGEEKGALLNKPESIQEEKVTNHVLGSNVESGQHEVKEVKRDCGVNGHKQINEVIKVNEVIKERKRPKTYCAFASCGNKGRHRCCRCKAVFYCHKDCLSKDWAHHKMFCDYVYEANIVSDDSTSKNPSEIQNTSDREEVD